MIVCKLAHLSIPYICRNTLILDVGNHFFNGFKMSELS